MTQTAIALAEDWIASGRIVDIALVFIAIEFAILMMRRSADPLFQRALGVFLALGPGACLMLALRCALTGTSPLWVAFWLAASLPLHLWDVARRRF